MVRDPSGEQVLRDFVAARSLGLDERFYRYRVGQPTSEEVAVTGMPPGGKAILVHKLS